MTPTMDELRRELTALPRDSRAYLAQCLIESLDEPVVNHDVETKWHEVAARRAAEVRAGAVVCRSAEEVLTDVRRLLQCK